MKVAVVTPYYKESVEVLSECHQSVLDQTFLSLHVMVADGFPKQALDDWNVDHIVLPKSHNDVGSTPRLIGCFHAIGMGADAVAFLDADNWYRKDHIENLVALYKTTQAGFLSSSRMLCRPDGTLMAKCPLINQDTFIDTNCMLFTRSGFSVLHHLVLMPSYGHLIGDRIMLYHVKKSKIRHAHLDSPTVYYRCGKEGIYRHLGEKIPDGVQKMPDYQSSFDKWVRDGNSPLI